MQRRANLSMDTLRSFVTIAESGSYTRAALELGRTQPAISLQIKKLEQQLAQQLLLRDGGQLQLTAAGTTLLDYARRILTLNDEALQQLTQPALSGSIHLGLPSEFASSLLPNIVSRFAKSYPQVTLSVTTALSRQLTAKPLRQQLDLVLALHDQAARDTDGHIKSEQLVWVGNQHTVINRQQSIPLVVAPEGCRYRERAQQQLEARQLRWQVVYSNPDLNGIEAAIEAGLGITVLAKSTVPGRLKILDDPALPGLGSIGIRLLFAEHRHQPVVEVLADYIRSSLVSG